MTDLCASPATPVDDSHPEIIHSRSALRGRLSRLATASVAIASFGSGGFTALWFETPSASSAPRRVTAILAAHGASSDDGIIPSRVATAVLAILAMYLDAAYFGDGAYGIVDASYRYFGVSPAALTWGQASLLAGLLQSPSAYNPAHHLAAALRRRSEVLARLRTVGVLTPAQLVEVGSEPLAFAIATSG